MRFEKAEQLLHLAEQMQASSEGISLSDIQEKFEIEAPIVRQAGISTVIFFDAGNAYGDVWGRGAIDPTDVRAAYGFGIRWFSPMGPLRFEWGFPVNPRSDERAVVFDFSMGSMF